MRRRYKKFLAAVAGAAVLSTTVLPGISLPKVHATENTNANNLLTPANANPDSEHPENSPSQNPQPPTNAKKDKILARPNDENRLSIFRRMKNTAYPFSSNLARLGEQPVATLTNQQVLYQTSNFKEWAWHESSYPQDMVFGVFLEDVRLSEIANLSATNALNPLNGVDFDQQFVVYAYLGSVATHGYGIGIEKIAQAGNNITVTIRSKSPQPNEENPPVTKIADFVPVSRKTLDFSKPIQITFIDQKGAVLFNYTIPANT